jgi:hypothetical protein
MPAIVENEKSVWRSIPNKFPNPLIQGRRWLEVRNAVLGDVVTITVGKDMIKHIYLLRYAKVVRSPAHKQCLYSFIPRPMSTRPFVGDFPGKVLRPQGARFSPYDCQKFIERLVLFEFFLQLFILFANFL